jgi:hypothetical protein
MTKVNLKFTNDPNVGYKFYAPIIAETTMFQLNESSNAWAYFDNVLFAQLICASNSKRILDFGCYLGVLPLLVEDIISQTGTEPNLEWILVDNFSYLIASKNDRLAERRSRLADPWINFTEKFPWAQELTLPPTTPNELYSLLSAINRQVDIKMPNITIQTTIEPIEGQVDLISFDLNADNFYTNQAALIAATKLLKDGGIIVMDDVKTIHLSQMALFVSILNSDLNLYPIAFGRGKVALLKSPPNEKDERIAALFKNLNIFASDKSKEDVFSWIQYDNPIFGKCISLNIWK